LRRSINPGDIDSAMKIVRTFGGSDDDLVKIQEYISQEFRELGDNRILYLAETSDRVVGMVQLVLRNANNDAQLANGKDVAHVHALQIAKDLHRQGFGYLLMQQLEEEARKSGLVRLTLGVDQDNEKAIHLYKKLGYVLFREANGRSPEVKLYYMQKSLS